MTIPTQDPPPLKSTDELLELKKEKTKKKDAPGTGIEFIEKYFR